MNRAFVIVATGHSNFGQMALNLCLSIKANSNYAVILLHTSSAVMDIDVTRFDSAHQFDYRLVNYADNPAKQAFLLKLLSYQILIHKPYDTFILLDADTIVLPGNNLDDWFENKKPFHAYYNDLFSFETNTYVTKNYHFWCDPLEAKKYFKIPSNAFMPQINASFIYFRKSPYAKAIFEKALEVWYDEEFTYSKYRDTKTEEMCLNIACALVGRKPDQVPYRPIWMQCYSESRDITYIQHRFNAIALTGNVTHDKNVLDLYNRLSDYYRSLFGIRKKFHFTQNAKQEKVYRLSTSKTILARIGAFGPISDGGVINPGAVRMGDNYIMLLRCDANLQGYKGHKERAKCVPVLAKYDLQFNLISTRVVEIHGWDGYLLEDFRLMEEGFHGGCSAYINGHWAQLFFSLVGLLEPNPTIVVRHTFSEPDQDEKNWGWFEYLGHLHYIYSIEPLIIKPLNRGTLVEIPFESGWKDEGFISCSTMPVKYGEDYLVWVHKKQKDLTYLNSAMILDGVTLKPIYFYPHHLLDFENIEQPMYISSCIVEEDRILIFSGEKGTPEMHNAATAYSSVRIIDRNKFDSLLKQFPCKQI